MTRRESLEKMKRASPRGRESDRDSLATAERYSRALQLTAPKVAARTAGLAVEGYWLDERFFFFLAERLEPSLGYVVAVPSILDADSGGVEEVISLEDLAALLSRHSGHGVTAESLASAAFEMPQLSTLAVTVGGHDYLIDRQSRSVATSRASLDKPALYSPDGQYACFVKGYDLWVRELGSEKERALTTDGAKHYAYGQKSETGLSTIAYRRRPHPIALWSADSQWVLTHRVDERSLPELPIVQHVPPGGGRPVLHTFKYSMPGDPLAVATYVAIHVPTGQQVSFDDMPAELTSPWAPRMEAWFSDAATAWFIRFDRYFKRVDLVRLDLERGTARAVVSETVPSGYVELHHVGGSIPNVRTLAESNEVIWFSERDGWGHLYLYDGGSGELKNRITSGAWLVRDIVDVNERERSVLFLAGGFNAETDPARRSLCSVNLDGSGFRVLLTHDGDITVPRTPPYAMGQDRPHRPSRAPRGISPNGRRGVVLFASAERGNVTEVVDLRSLRGQAIASARPEHGERVPRHFTALAADGVTRLHGLMLFPSDFDPGRRYPLIDFIYPGPQVAQQPQSFRSGNSACARALAELGFVTIMLDTRGVPLRSRALHQAGYGELLEPQLADHASVVRQLCERHTFLDASRIGIFGQSAGGAATARAMCDYNDLFKVGVVACGYNDASVSVASWSNKYRGEGAREQWLDQSIAAVAHKLTGKLLLISGDLDESVHVSHTLSICDALARANKDFDLLIVPNAGHDVLLTNDYVQRRVWDYFVRHLLDTAPPPGFEVRFEPHELTRMLTCWMREFWQ